MSDILSDPHYQRRGAWSASSTIRPPGPFAALRLPLREAGGPRPSARYAAALLGADTEAVLTSRLGLDRAADIAALRAERVI